MVAMQRMPRGLSNTDYRIYISYYTSFCAIRENIAQVHGLCDETLNFELLQYRRILHSCYYAHLEYRILVVLVYGEYHGQVYTRYIINIYVYRKSCYTGL